MQVSRSAALSRCLRGHLPCFHARSVELNASISPQTGTTVAKNQDFYAFLTFWARYNVLRGWQPIRQTDTSNALQELPPMTATQGPTARRPCAGTLQLKRPTRSKSRGVHRHLWRGRALSSSAQLCTVCKMVEKLSERTPLVMPWYIIMTSLLWSHNVFYMYGAPYGYSVHCQCTSLSLVK